MSTGVNFQRGSVFHARGPFFTCVQGRYLTGRVISQRWKLTRQPWKIDPPGHFSTGSKFHVTPAAQQSRWRPPGRSGKTTSQVESTCSWGIRWRIVPGSHTKDLRYKTLQLSTNLSLVHLLSLWKSLKQRVHNKGLILKLRLSEMVILEFRPFCHCVLKDWASGVFLVDKSKTSWRRT